MMVGVMNQQTLRVAPARERGLKLRQAIMCFLLLSRSREGAWIEIELVAGKDYEAA